MITLFRRIREKLIASGSITKYLLYVAGEILLVVIGILIALQVNNWNEERKDRFQEQLILQNLQKEIRTNLEELERDHILNEQSMKALLSLLDTDKRMNYSPATIDSLIGQAYNFATFDVRSGVIEEITASGSVSLIQDEELKYMFSQWSGEFNDLMEDALIRREYWIHNVSPLLNTLIPIRNNDRTNTRSDYVREFVIKPITVPQENYKKFMMSLAVDGMLYESYMNQSFVYINEENIKAYLLEFLRIVEENIND